MDNREAILNSALNLFWARGYDATGVQEIVDQAGITKPTLYYYFGSKQGLLQEILITNSRQLEEELREAVSRKGDIPTTLYRVARAYCDFAENHRKFYMFMLSQFYAGRETEGFRAVYPLIRKYYQLVVQIFADASQELGNMGGRQEQFAISFIGILDSHMMLAFRDLSEEKSVTISDEQTYEIVRQFLYGIYS